MRPAHALRVLVPLFLVGLGSGCGGPVGKAYDYPLDDTLRLDQIQVKGTHNSYHIEKDGPQGQPAIPPWQYTMAPLDVQLDQQGVRQVELDLNWIQDDVGDGHHFEVFHVTLADDSTTCRLFTDCLRTIKKWSDRYPGHLPIYIEMETKDGFTVEGAEDYFAEIDREILSVFPRERIITPDEVQGSAATLPEALQNGWPTLGKLRGRIFFGIDESDEVRTAYTHGDKDLHGRLAFIDSSPDMPYGALAILNDPTEDDVAAAIPKALAAHLLVRTRSDTDGDEARANDKHRFQLALQSGANFISTDFPAPVAGLDYYIEIPDGTPARCNPVTAKDVECTSLDLENPAFVGSGK